MLTTTRSLVRFPRGEGPAHPFGHPTLTATMSPLQRSTRKMQRFWYMNRKIEACEFNSKYGGTFSRTTLRNNDETSKCVFDTIFVHCCGVHFGAGSYPLSSRRTRCCWLWECTAPYRRRHSYARAGSTFRLSKLGSRPGASLHLPHECRSTRGL